LLEFYSSEKTTMKIVADENIPFVKNAFENLGEVILCTGRNMTNEIVRDADILLVRSVTPVNADLLAGSRVKFAATATIGMDHLDEAYLNQAGIGFTNAAGSNSNSVAEYIMAALLTFAIRRNISLAGKVLGVVGVGNIGSKVVRKAEGLGMKVLQNDPPLARQTGEKRFIPLDDLMDADFITAHVPLTKEGIDKTFHLFNQERLSQMKSGSVFINASRGGVHHTEAVKKMVQSGHPEAVILDVWENEPHIDGELLRQVELGTPHIAGYSFDGKVNGTIMIYQAACRYFGLPPTWDAARAMPQPEPAEFVLDAANKSDEQALYELIIQIYSIEADDRNLRKFNELSADERGAYFDRLRKNYPQRREFLNYEINVKNGKPSLKSKLAILGFHVG
jgi:erythronate-4-phosphate dehydrogenase